MRKYLVYLHTVTHKNRGVFHIYIYAWHAHTYIYILYMYGIAAALILEALKAISAARISVGSYSYR